MLDPIMGTGFNAGSGTGYHILCCLSNARSGTRYRTAISIYLFRIWYWVPILWSILFYRFCIRLGIRSCVLYIMGPVLVTGLNAGSGTGFQTLCQIQYWVPDPMFCPISGLLLDTGSQSIFIYYGPGTWYRILLYILSTGSVVRNQILLFYIFWIWYWVPDLMPDPVLGTSLNARSGTGYLILCFG